METWQMRQRHVPRHAALHAVGVRIHGQKVSPLHTRCISQEISWKRGLKCSPSLFSLEKYNFVS